MNYQQGYEDGVRATKAEYLKLLEEESHPVKELTDEEIDMLAHEYNCIDDYPHEFVRACIRKAQEK